MDEKVVIDDSDGVVRITPPANGMPVHVHLRAGQTVQLARDGTLVVTPATVRTLTGPLRFSATVPLDAEARANVSAMRSRIEQMMRAETTAIDAAARVLLDLDPSQGVDTDEVCDLIARRRMHVVRIGASEVEIREGVDVRWRGRWTWTGGEATWSAEWVSPAP